MTEKLTFVIEGFFACGFALVAGAFFIGPPWTCFVSFIRQILRITNWRP